jgi:hypothetical protein
MKTLSYPSSVLNGNLEVPVFFSKVKQGYTFRKMKKYKWIQYALISAGMKFRNKKKFGYGISEYTGAFRALCP